ncbi:hypothetical protein F5Y18DRAFT_434249 [Xylariaceae sp. FL1019]|nr:hypothetical protein F5Y18DRAFT_434249 [Xylariaceae sp. FL1019]
MFNTISGVASSIGSRGIPQLRHIEARQSYRTLCNVQNWPSAPIDILKTQAYHDLYAGAAEPLIVSIGMCLQQWCGGGAALWVCNDGPYFVQANKMVIADMMNNCIDACPDPKNSSISQCQIFPEDTSNNYNIIVRGDNDCFWGERPTSG